MVWNKNRTTTTSRCQTEKILKDYGIEPEEFKEQELLRDYESFKKIKTT